MRFHPDLHLPHLHLRERAGKLHWPHRHGRTQDSHTHAVASCHTPAEDAEIAKATCYVSVVTLVMLLAVLAAIAFGQEAMHWLGVG